MVYVALLRGINVGGNAKVEMAKLRQMVEGLGLKSVKTYINSGNVIFEASKTSDDELVKKIERAIAKEFELNVPVVVRSLEQIEQVCRAVPQSWTNDSHQRTDVMFLWPKFDSKDVIQSVKINPSIERVKYVGGAVVWNIERKYVTRGYGGKLIGTELYKHMTGRNINTVRKLFEMMK